MRDSHLISASASLILFAILLSAPPCGTVDDEEGAAVLCDFVCVFDDDNSRCEWSCEDPEIEVACGECQYVCLSGACEFNCEQCDIFGGNDGDGI